MELGENFYRVFHPKPVFLLVSKGKNKVNVMALAWHMPISLDNRIIGVAIDKENYSHQLIMDTKEFSLNLLPINEVDKIWFSGTRTGKKVDKIKVLKFELEDGIKISVPHIKNSLAWVECKVEREIDFPDHTLFLSKVLYAWADPKYFKDCWIENSPVPLHVGKKYFAVPSKYVTPQKR